MKKSPSDEKEKKVQDIRPSYDFSAGVRGKHAKALRDGYTVEIHQADGTTVVQEVALAEGTVVLDPDVRAYFPDSEAVNSALRCLIPLIASSRTSEAKL